MADEQVGFGPACHGCQTFQELQRLEALGLSLTRSARGHALEIQVQPEAPHPRPRARAQRHPTLDGGADDPRQHGGLVRELIRRPRRAVAGLERP